MPLPLPNLDTRRFDDLVAEMRALIPRHAPEWTNHNPSDPGIALVELLAWITEAMLYRINRIPQKTYLIFVSLLLDEPLAEDDLESFKLKALKKFNEPYRVLTAEDFAREAARASTAVGRVNILSNASEGQVVVVIVPATGGAPDSALLKQVKQYLDERRLVGTRLVVRGPLYTAVKLEVKVVPETNTRPEVVKAEVENKLKDYLDPLKGGHEGRGWPFGRTVSIFELYHLIEAIAGVDHVESIVINGDSQATEVSMPGDYLPDLQLVTVDLTS
jgi:hypothetical protein